MMLMTKLVELINKGTLGLSKDRVQSDTATCIAEDNADTEEMRTYVMDASLTCAGTNAAASWLDAAMRYNGHDGSEHGLKEDEGI